MVANVKKTLYFLQRNGVKKTFYAVKERLETARQPKYVFEEISEEEQKAEEEWFNNSAYEMLPLISILVPAYNTKEEYLRDLTESVLSQTYGKWELIIADASDDDSVKDVLCGYTDERIKYIKLNENKGIAQNTNEGLKHATGDYVALLDHDDVLCKNALFENAFVIAKSENKPDFIYSDEDKFNKELGYFDVNKKADFNLDLLLTNNYICHFLVVRADLIEKIGLEEEYDGAQDYRLVLRLLNNRCSSKDRLASFSDEDFKKIFAHIGKVLYHWRSHPDSTAENPKSKLYAYEAGKKALQNFYDNISIKAFVIDSEHVGFYKTVYSAASSKFDPFSYCNAIFKERPDIVAIGGRVLDRYGRKIKSGLKNEKNKPVFYGLNSHYAGPCNAAHLCRDAYALDRKCLHLKRDYIYLTAREWDSEAEFFAALREKGRILYDPSLEVKNE